MRRAQWHYNRITDVRNIAKISPKMARKQPFFDLFRFSQKLHTIQTKCSTVILHHLRVLCVHWHHRIIGISEMKPKIVQKRPKNGLFWTFFNFRKNCPYDSNEFLYSHSTPYFDPICAILSNSYDWDSSESEAKRSKPTILPLMRL